MSSLPHLALKEKIVSGDQCHLNLGSQVSHSMSRMEIKMYVPTHSKGQCRFEFIKENMLILALIKLSKEIEVWKLSASSRVVTQ